jgi:stalled ribosome rescue protein Dom34
MSHYHAVVWLDHREARVFFFNRDGFDEATVDPNEPHRHLHHRGGSISGKRGREDRDYFRRIVETLSPAQEWLILGPSTEKLELAKYIRAHDADLARRILGVESADHPTDRQIVAHARRFFGAADRMIGRG